MILGVLEYINGYGHPYLIYFFYYWGMRAELCPTQTNFNPLTPRSNV